MNIFQNSDMFQKLLQSGFEAIGYVLTAGLAVILILAWALTEPLFQLAEKVAHREKLKNAALKMKIMNKGTGIALLVVGVAMIIYGFNAPDSVSSDVSRIIAGAPTEKTMCLLLGGSAAMVVGAVMTFRGSGNA
jgi:hypothetical protein